MLLAQYQPSVGSIAPASASRCGTWAQFGVVVELWRD